MTEVELVEVGLALTVPKDLLCEWCKAQGYQPGVSPPLTDFCAATLRGWFVSQLKAADAAAVGKAHQAAAQAEIAQRQAEIDLVIESGQGGE